MDGNRVNRDLACSSFVITQVPDHSSRECTPILGTPVEDFLIIARTDELALRYRRFEIQMKIPD